MYHRDCGSDSHMTHISDENKQTQFNYIQSIEQMLYAECKL